jgi:hypothetical protein
MQVSFTNISNKVFKYVVNIEDNLSSIIPKLFADNKIDSVNKSIRFIFKGQILNHEKLFSEFTEDNPNIIFMITKIKTKSDDPPQPHPTTQSNMFNQVNQQEQTEELDSVDKLRAAVMGVLVFIRTNPQLAELFNNKFETLLDVMSSHQIKPLFDKMVNETDEGNSDYLDELSESLLNINSYEQNDSNPEDDTADDTADDPGSNPGSNPNSNTILLTQTDLDNINNIVKRGFNKQDVLLAYVLSNKNIDETISYLRLIWR